MSELAKRLAEISPAKRILLEQRLKNDPKVVEPIAIVGMACRFPGAADLDAYWRLIRDGVDATGEIPSSRWDVDALYDPSGEEDGKMSVRWAGMVDDVDKFDAPFFGIAPREAAKMDPQQRFLLEVAWEALESGGLAPQRLSGSATGVFVGIGGTDYSKVLIDHEDYLQQIDAHSGTGNALSLAANRLSYIFDFHGPSFAVDTACSSGTVGVHLAVQSLRNRDCDTALAGAVNLILAPETTIAFSKARMLSPDGQCRPFDASANGYVRGEGCALLVLKRLTDATRDGDEVLAVLRATAMNQDGRTSGITAPNGLFQQAVIRSALAQAGLAPDSVSYVEAHGTSTPLGDPIEIDALGKVFRQRDVGDPPVYVTSVKANIGHTETVSGVAGIIKVVLMMRHGVIPAQLHLESLNPHISLAGSRLQIPRAPLPWKAGTRPRIAGVSSFGFGGTNTHVLLEEASPPKATLSKEPRPAHVMTISAKNQPALAKLADRYLDYLDRNPKADIAAICHTANVGRSHFNFRAAFTSENREQWADRCKALRDGKQASGLKTGQVKLLQPPKVAFLFTGQGSQYVGMGRDLYDSHPTFRDALTQCDEILRDRLEHSLISVMFGEVADQSLLDETAYTQPALFSLEYALAELWRSWGIEPSVVLGHSVGEYVAACVAGILSLEDGLTLIAHRGRLMQQLPRNGLMAVIFAPPSRIEAALKPHSDRVSIAAHNGPENTVISGDASTVQSLVASFEAEGLRTTMLTVSHAFHSPLMEPMLDEFERLAGDATYNRPRVPLVSNLTGHVLTDSVLDATYWRDHIRGAVRFADAVQHVAELESHVMLEVGPSATLSGMGRTCLPKFPGTWLASLREKQPGLTTMLTSLADLYVIGAEVDWSEFDRHWPHRRLSLPTYPFQRAHHWLNASPRGVSSSTASPRGPLGHPLLGRRVHSPLETTLFETRLSCRSPKYLVDHQVQGSPVTPAAAYVEQALAIGQQLCGPGNHVVENLAIQQAMFLPEGESRSVQIAVGPELSGEHTFESYSLPVSSQEDKPRWTMHACGKVRYRETEETNDQSPQVDLEQVRQDVGATSSRSEFYEGMAQRGLAYGPAFQVLDSMGRTDCSVLAEVKLPDDVQKELSQYHLHPALGDALFQAAAGLVPQEHDGSFSPYTYMPTFVRAARLRGELTNRMYVYGQRTSDESQPSPETVEGNLYLLDENGCVLVELLGVRVQRVGRSLHAAGDQNTEDWLYQVRWEEQQQGQQAAASTQTRDDTWVIFADRRGTGRQLSERLHDRGARCILVEPSHEFGTAARNNGDAEVVRIDPLNGEHYRMLLDQMDASESLRIVHLWSLDIEPASESTRLDFAQARRLGCGSVLRLVQQLARSKFDRNPSLHLSTSAAQQVGDDSSTIDGLSIAQAPLWGLGRVAAMEHPELRTRLIDLDRGNSLDRSAAQLEAEVLADGDEDQIAFRGERRFVARLQHAADVLSEDEATADSGLMVPADSSFRLRLDEPGRFDSLRYEKATRRTPDSQQVEIEVHATGLNFSDVLKAMGLYPGLTDEVVPLGIECSGIVTAIGDEVDRFKVGDPVMGVAPYSFASHALTADYALVHKPETLSHAEAATIPVTFLTAYYALIWLARLQPGERVLIHAGAGGVGLAAIQIAQHVGAEVFATAGSDEKRDYLRSLGVGHVMNSRTLDFADQIMQITKREGVDVVLNSLPADAITKSLSSLRAYGRFLEIGKTDIYQNRMIGLLPFQDNLSYFAIDLDRMLRQRGDSIRRLFDEVVSHFEKGAYRPLAVTEFPVEGTTDAFRYMAQRKNIGKVVVTLEQRPARSPDESTADTTAEALPEEGSSDAALIRADGAYLVTGGLGALGLQVSQWLAEQGATHLVLMSRRAASQAAAKSIKQIEAGGVRVATVQGDVADQDSLSGALKQIPAEFPPLRGVVHAAGVLDDGVLFDMELERLDRPMAPKVHGAWNLHVATIDRPLDFFVLFSSIACVLGSPGQGNYAAGNAFLDALAAYRRSNGLPAISINWGPWADSGMAADAAMSDQMKSRGMELIPPAQGLALLEQLISASAANAAVISVRWSDMLGMMRNNLPSILRDIAETAGEAQAEQSDDGVDHAFREKLLAVDQTARLELLQDYFTDELARIMGFESSQLDTSQPLNELGMDSLMAMELKNNLEGRLAFSLPMASFMDGPSIGSLAEHAAKAIGAEPAAAEVKTDGAQPSSKTWTPLVPLQPQGETSPLFCVHPIGGDVRCYVEIAKHLAEDRPVYALRPRGLEPFQRPHQSMEELAADYVEAIRDVQPQGPYDLAGWSTGGIFAYAMADVIRRQGEKVGTLAFFDTPVPSIMQYLDLDDDARFLFDYVEFVNHIFGAQMNVTYEQLSSLDPDDAFQTALAEAKRCKVVPADVATDYMKRFVEVGRSNLRVLMNYEPPALDQSVHLFKPVDGHVLLQATGQVLDDQLGWGEVARDHLLVYQTPGDHFSMVTGEHAEELAEKFKRLAVAV